MNLKPHILFISSWFPSNTSSAGTFVELHLQALQSRGCKCAILLSGEATLGNFAARGFRKSAFLKFRRRENITYIDNLTIHFIPLRLFSNPIKRRKQNIINHAEKVLTKYVSKHGKPDFIFHHGVFDYCYLTNHIKQVFDLPVWLLENSPNLKKEHFPCANVFDTIASQKEFVHQVERRFAVTQAYVNKMSQLFGVPFELCPNVITDDFFIDPKRIAKSDEFFQFINIAILTERKNQKLIIEAFAKRFKNKKNFRLVIAGDGPLLQMLRDRATELGVADQCRILGFQNREKIIELLDESHCFVLSSHSETFGVVIIEAMARGLPAVSSRIDGPLEIINNKNGYFFEPDNVDDLGDKMENIVHNYSQFNPKEIIEDIKHRFGPDAVKNALFKNE